LVDAPLHVAAADLASLAIDTEGLAARLRQPVLWIGADALDEQHLRCVFRDVQFGRVVGSGHFPQLEVPNQVNAMIERFVATLPAGR
jgi:pimeloyl-ACP methyl ester carboxylesterase